MPSRLDAVIRTLGASLNLELIFSGTRLFSEATRIIVDAMEAKAVKRLFASPAWEQATVVAIVVLRRALAMLRYAIVLQIDGYGDTGLFGSGYPVRN